MMNMSQEKVYQILKSAYPRFLSVEEIFIKVDTSKTTLLRNLRKTIIIY